MSNYPKIEYVEQVLRDGLQIEDASISVDDRLLLLDLMQDAGLNAFEIGSFVSPKWTPQMACIDEFVQRMKPRPGIKYFVLALNERGRERAAQYPFLTVSRLGVPIADISMLRCYICDVFAKRNTNEGRADQMARWPKVVAEAVAAGAKQAGFGFATGWGSNWVGEFTLKDHMEILEQQHRMWDEVGIPVTCIRIADEMSWAMPDKVEETVVAIKMRWPEVSYWDLHLHNARGLALVNIYQAIRSLTPDDTLLLEGSLGGIGGCPYCGNGRATGMAPTEDLMHMLQGIGINVGVDLDKLIDAVWLLEKMIGRRSFGHLANAGPRPTTKDKLYAMDMPFIETLEQAKHFKLGPKVYEGGINPWKETIKSDMRPGG